jgi:2EXR family
MVSTRKSTAISRANTLDNNFVSFASYPTSQKSKTNASTTMNSAMTTAKSEPKTKNHTGSSPKLPNPELDAAFNSSTTMDSTKTSDLSEPNEIEATGNPSTTPETEANDLAAVVPVTIGLKFERFPKLPPELRIRVWKLVPEARIVVVRFDRDGRKHCHKFAASFPAILHACQESRHEGLKMYHRAFDSKWALNGVYFNFKTDTLCMLNWAYLSQKQFFIRKIKSNDLGQIESVALRAGHASFGLAGTVYKFPALKEAIYMDVYGDSHEEMKSCSSAEGSLHSIKEVLESNSGNKGLCQWLQMSQMEFSGIKNAFEESDQGYRVAIHHRIVCTRGVPRGEDFLTA